MGNTNLIVKWIGTLAILLLGLTVRGQSDPMYTQYIFNLQTINPAYTGSWQTVGFQLLSRYQWAGIKESPSTQTFSFQSPFIAQNVGLGFNVVNDKVGLERRFAASIDYSYRIFLTENTSLRFGIKGGFTNYHNDLSGYTLEDGQYDPSFQDEIVNLFMPNLGFGLFLSSPEYYVSVSLPKLINNHYEANISAYTVESNLRQLFVGCGIVKNLSDYVKFKPTLMTRAIKGEPFECDIAANFLLGEKVWFGGMYRSTQSVGAIVQWVFKSGLRFGYASDFPVGGFKTYQRMTHEVSISYELPVLKRIFISPRYF